MTQWEAFDVVVFAVNGDLQVFDLETDVRTLREQLAGF